MAEAVDGVEALDEFRAILGGEARSVDVVAVEQELTQLWKAAADDTAEGRSVVRACVLNLVAYATGDDVAQHINEVISQISGRHPSRSIVIVADTQAKAAQLRASISAHCQIPPEGGKQVCSEQVTLHASGAAVDELHGTVLPLLIPDLPVFLWWHDEPSLGSHLLQELLDSADRLVIDSADFPPQRAAGALADIQRLTRENDVALSDLNWSRLTHWRELIAQFFDAPPGRQYLDRLDGVSVGIASTHGWEADLTEGLLLVGWLASRMGWTLEEWGQQPRGGAVAFALRGAIGPVAVELSPGPAHPGEELHSLSLRAGAEATFAISRKADDEACVVATAEMPDGAGHSRVVRMDVPSEATLLCDELDTLGHDVVFEEALAQAVRFMTASR
jgi:glucose-6-phosphate dehydrogenase assembly protein OpcA